MQSSSNAPESQVRQPRSSYDSVPTLAPQRAVQEYLDTLLQDAVAQAREEDILAVQVPVEIDLTEALSEPVAAVVGLTTTEVADAAMALTAPPSVVAQSEIAPAGAWCDGRPTWAQQRFECLLFKVAGLTLAVPLVELGGVLVVEKDLRPLFGQPDWFLGLLPSKATGTVKAVDTARWVMPEKYTDAAGNGFKYVVLMAGSDWGMACHSVEDAITLEPHQVRWRSDRSRRPWLAGTVIDHMCAIMDVAALRELLQQSQAANAELN